MKQKNWTLIFWLFRINLFISAFTFGGGYVVIPMMRKYFVSEKKLISEQELSEMAAIAQSSPGAIAVNLAILAGYKTAGYLGAVTSCIASVLPPLFILSIISKYYSVFRNNHLVSCILKGMEAAVAAMIIELVIDMSIAIFHENQPFFSFIIPISFVAHFFLHIHVFILLILCTIFCFVISWLKMKGESHVSDHM